MNGRAVIEHLKMCDSGATHDLQKTTKGVELRRSRQERERVPNAGSFGGPTLSCAKPRTYPCSRPPGGNGTNIAILPYGSSESSKACFISRYFSRSFTGIFGLCCAHHRTLWVDQC
jgi:hypothetical protein